MLYTVTTMKHSSRESTSSHTVVSGGSVELVSTPRRRYLSSFDPKRVPHRFADVLIIGSGIAGVRAALEIDPQLRVVIVTKDRLELSNSAWAQGGIAGALDPSDTKLNHVEDTLTAGAGLCDRRVVESVVNAAPELIRELMRLGAHFDLHGGELALTTEGGHSHPRVAHALGDATGKEVMRALIDRLREHKNCEIWEKTFTIDLLTQDNACSGAIVWHPGHGKTFVWAKQTILCTGGAGRLYRETTNPDIATADGHAVAFRAGATVRDMEMMQFHPTVLYIAGGSRHLISEAVRGEGAYLIDSRGHRFMSDYHPLLELAPRDIVSRAITDQMELTRHSCVYLDLRHLPEEKVIERFPHIRKVCQEFGLDLARDPIPVRPGAHYMIGGLTVDLEGRTSIPHLWAAGEVTSTGLHGANRLASNSLLEGLYYGLRCGRGASAAALSIPDDFSVPPLVSAPPSHMATSADDLNLVDLRNSLASLMGRHVGIRRDEEGLASAAEQVEFWDRYVAQREFHTVEGWELQNMLLTAKLMIASARARQESRGVHYRSDYPQPVFAPQTHVVVRRGRM